MIGQTFGRRYAVVRKIGEGSMGAVFEARHTGTERRVALKIINEESAAREDLVQRFRIEAKAAGLVDSEHIAQVLDLDLDEESQLHFLAMELLDGEDLKGLLERLGALPIDLAMRISIQASRGLAKAHAKGVLHRDVKPANVFVTRREDGRRVVKLLDFGIAKLRNEAQGVSSITKTGTLMGSPQYMSPEQTNGLRDIDHRSDIWSLGVVMYEMLAGKPPFTSAEGVGDLIVRINTQRLKLWEEAPWVPPDFARVVDRALTIELGERWQSMDELLGALEALSPDGADIQEAMLETIDDTSRSSRYDLAERIAAAVPSAPLSAAKSATPKSRVPKSSTPEPSRLPIYFLGFAVFALSVIIGLWLTR